MYISSCISKWDDVPWMLNAFMDKCIRDAYGIRGVLAGEMNTHVLLDADDAVLLTKKLNYIKCYIDCMIVW